MLVHVLLSVAAAALLTVAALQSLLLALQERLLHRPADDHGWASRLPPLQTMERLLFGLIAAGFGVLSLALLSGLLFIEDWFAQHLVNKTLLSVCAWVIFGVLLWGRHRYGWRGRAATGWALSGYALLLVAYFGSKYVLNNILY